MAIDWNKPVVTADGIEPLLSPPNVHGHRVGWVLDKACTWGSDGDVLYQPGHYWQLRNKPETVKVWLKLGRSGDGLIRGTVYPYGSIGYAGCEWLHGPIEITIPEGK